jgi:hypothetical protein
MPEYTDGPTDQEWQTTEDIDAFWYVHRTGFWQRNRAMPVDAPIEENFYVQGPKWASELAARLNRLDALEAALRVLAEAVEAERKTYSAYVMEEDNISFAAWRSARIAVAQALAVNREVLG